MLAENLGPTQRMFPTQIVLCGAYDQKGRPDITPLGLISACANEPPVIGVGIMKSRHIHDAILGSKAFSVNIPDIGHLAETDFCGMVSGRDMDKFAACGLTPRKGEYVNAPLVDEFPIGMECQLLQVIELGSHDLFLGEIKATWLAKGIKDETGWVNLEKVDTFVYMPEVKGKRHYYALGKPVGMLFNAGLEILKKIREQKKN